MQVGTCSRRSCDASLSKISRTYVPGTPRDRHTETTAAGEWITASGEWVNDRTHGQQFKARFLRTSPPTSNDYQPVTLSTGRSGLCQRQDVDSRSNDPEMAKTNNIKAERREDSTPPNPRA